MKLLSRVEVYGGTESHPAGVRGLKPGREVGVGYRHWVAPRRGAWVETAPSQPFAVQAKVAPRRGAWVETPQQASLSRLSFRSHPAGVRGLKRKEYIPHNSSNKVAPRRGAWVETRI